MKIKQKLKSYMRRLRRITVYILAYVIIMLLTILISKTSLLKPIDIYLYEKAYLSSDSIGSPENYFKFFNLQSYDKNGKEFSPAEKRSQVIQFLNTIDLITPEDPKMPPLVVLDISFNNNSDKIDSLKYVIDCLKDKNIKVYGAYDMPSKGETFEKHDPLQAEDLYYDYFEGGRLHTKVNVFDVGVFTYESFIPIKKENGILLVPSLPIKVIDDFTDRPSIESDSIPTYFTLPIRPKEFLSKIKDQTFKISDSSFVPANNKNLEFNSLDLSKKILIVGFTEDVQNIKNEIIPGHILVGMAMWNELNGHKFTKDPYENKAFHLGLEIFCALLVVFIFDLMFKRIKMLQTNTWLIAILSFLIGLIILYLIFLFQLSSGKIIRPSVSILSMLWACVLAWHFSIKFLVTGIIEGSKKYDVFISYSHGDSVWVEKYLYNPLSEFKKPNNEKLKIFYDKKSIGIGEAFTIKYMKAIVDSKVFVPVMSDEYYKKNHCRNEMDLAVKRSIEERIRLFPIAFSFDCIPEHYNHIISGDSVNQNDFINELEKELIKDEQKQQVEKKITEKSKLDMSTQDQKDKLEINEVIEKENHEMIQIQSKETIKSEEINDLEESQEEESQEEESQEEEIKKVKKKKDKKLDKKDKKEKSKVDNKKSKKDKKNTEKSEKEKAKKEAKKVDKKKAKTKLDKKEKDKKSKKGSNKKNKKSEKKKSKKSSEKKTKKEKKGKRKKS